MDFSPPVIAGAVSTLMFGLSMLPMLAKALRTRDLRSYSLGNILLSNTGNAIHSIYVFSLPAGPIWLPHSFHLLTLALMLIWYVRYESGPAGIRRRVMEGLSALVSLRGDAAGASRREAPARSGPEGAAGR